MFLFWQPTTPSGMCLVFGVINYTVTLETAGRIVEERMVSSESESCNDTICSIISTSRQMCGFEVSVVATNGLGSSNVTISMIGKCKIHIFLKSNIHCHCEGSPYTA